MSSGFRGSSKAPAFRPRDGRHGATNPAGRVRCNMAVLRTVKAEVDKPPIRGPGLKPFCPRIPVLPCIAKHHNDLRSDHDPNSRTHKQNDPDSDVMQVAGAFMPIPPSGPSSHDLCRCAHIQKNGHGIDDRNNDEGHAAETQAMCAPDITSQGNQRPCDTQAVS
jgi:hypothetical protein